MAVGKYEGGKTKNDGGTEKITASPKNVAPHPSPSGT
jgi:hypothetical protein